MLGNFKLPGPSGIHQCIVYEPMLISLLHFQATLDPKSLPEDLLKGALQQLLLALDYLHSEARVVHTGMAFFYSLLNIKQLTRGLDIQAKNIIIGAKEDSIFREWDNNEVTDPSP